MDELRDELKAFTVIDIGDSYMVGIRYTPDEEPTLFGEKKLEELAEHDPLYEQALRALRQVKEATEINNGKTTNRNE